MVLICAFIVQLKLQLPQSQNSRNTMNSEKEKKRFWVLPKIFLSHFTFSPWIISSTSSFSLHSHWLPSLYFLSHVLHIFLTDSCTFSSSFIKPLAVDHTFKLHYKSHLNMFAGVHYCLFPPLQTEFPNINLANEHASHVENIHCGKVSQNNTSNKC